MSTTFHGFSPEAVEHTVNVLNHGGVAMFPADTVYGFFGRGDLHQSVERVYDIKLRDRGKPFSLYTNRDDVHRWAVLDDVAKTLIEAFWPRALTLILPKSAEMPADFSALPTVGVLTATNPLLSAVIEQVDGPVFGTTVNYSGEPSLLKGTEVAQFADRVDVMVDADDLIVYNATSTILDCSRHPFAVIREGVIPIEEIRQVVDGVGIDESRRR